MAGTFTPGTNAYTVTGSTVDFNGSGAQTIPAFGFNNLTSSSTGARTLASSGTIGVAGAFTPGTNAYTITGSTVDFNGSGAQTIPAFAYNNLTSSSTGARTLPSGQTVFVAGAFTPGTNAYTVTGSTVDFNGSGAQTIPAFAYNNLTSSSTGARTLAASGTIGVAGTFTPGTNAYTVTGSTVNFNGSGAQTIPAFDYNNLTSSSTGARTLASSGTVGVAGTFTPGTNAYTITGSTVDFNGAGAQTIPAFAYNNLTSSSTGARTLAASGTSAWPGRSRPGTNAYTVTGSTVDFNGAGAQTIPAFAYNNLTSSSTGARTLAASGTIGVAGTFTPGTNAYTITGSTVNFNGAGPQTIPAFSYNNLTSSSTGARTLPSGQTVFVAGTFTPGTNAYTVTGSTVNFNGSGAQTIPAFDYNNLTSSSTGARTLASSGTIGVAGTFTPGTNAYTVTGSTVSFNGTAAQIDPGVHVQQPDGRQHRRNGLAHGVRNGQRCARCQRERRPGHDDVRPDRQRRVHQQRPDPAQPDPGPEHHARRVQLRRRPRRRDGPPVGSERRVRQHDGQHGGGRRESLQQLWRASSRTPCAASGRSRRPSAAQVRLGSPSVTMKWPAAWRPTSSPSTAACRAADHGRRWARPTRVLRLPGPRPATAPSKQPTYRSLRPARRTSSLRARPT